MILKDGSYEFKDLNKNGRIDVYEDWRRPVTERVEDLLSQMTLEEKAGFMIISQINMGSGADGRTPDGSLNEKDVITTANMFTGVKSDTAINVSAATKGILERHLRHFILRATLPV